MRYFVTVNGKKYEVEVEADERGVAKEESAAESAKASAEPIQNIQTEEGEALSAPMPGKIIDVKVINGQTVKKGDLILILEAMKMENEIMAPKDGIIKQVIVNKGDNVDTGQKLVIYS